MKLDAGWFKPRASGELQGYGRLRKPGHAMDGRRAMLLLHPDRETIKAQFDETRIDGKHNPFAYGWHCFPAAEFEIERSGIPTT